MCIHNGGLFFAARERRPVQQQTEHQSRETNYRKNIHNCEFATINFLACSNGRAIAQSLPRPLARSLMIKPYGVMGASSSMCIHNGGLFFAARERRPAQQQTEHQSWETNIQNGGFARISFLACSIRRAIAQSLPRPLARSLMIKPWRVDECEQGSKCVHG